MLRKIPELKKGDHAPVFSAAWMNQFVRAANAMQRSIGQGGVTLTKSDARWLISAEAAIADPVMSGYTCASPRCTRNASGVLGSFAAGDYLANYFSGAYLDVPGVWTASKNRVVLTYNGGTVSTADGSTWATWADAVSNYDPYSPGVPSSPFTHAGGNITWHFSDTSLAGNAIGDPTKDPAFPPLFGVITPLPKLLVEDQPTEESLSLYTSGAFVFPEIGFYWTGDPLIRYVVDLNFKAVIPSRNYLGIGTPPPSNDGCYLFYGSTIISNTATGVVGDMETITATAQTTFDTDSLGVAPNDSFLCHWRDGMAMTGCTFEIESFTVVSKTRL